MYMDEGELYIYIAQSEIQEGAAVIVPSFPLAFLMYLLWIVAVCPGRVLSLLNIPSSYLFDACYRFWLQKYLCHTQHPQQNNYMYL